MKTDLSKYLQMLKKDIIWWNTSLPHYNGVSFMAVEEWLHPDFLMSSDACISGCGGWFRGKYFHKQFPQFILDKNLHINALELLAIMVCLKLWGPDLKC